MFDIDFSLWIVVLVFAIIILRPKDWIRIMTKAGQHYSAFNSYKNEWVEYIEFSSHKKVIQLKKDQFQKNCISYHPDFFIANLPILFSRHEISVSLKI